MFSFEKNTAFVKLQKHKYLESYNGRWQRQIGLMLVAFCYNSLIFYIEGETSNN